MAGEGITAMDVIHADRAWSSAEVAVTVRRPGTGRQHTCDIACDSYHRYREDVALMASLVLRPYRLHPGTAAVLRAGLSTAARLKREIPAADKDGTQILRVAEP
jgi:hypothetical protein